MNDTRNKVGVTADGMVALLERAKQLGTVDRWTEIAIEWIEAADAEITRLKELLGEQSKH